MAVSVSFGSNWAYLTAHVEEGTERDRSVADNYYLKAAEHGEPPGQWLGRGALELGLVGVVERSQMEPLYGHLCRPDTGELLGTPLRRYAPYEERLAKLQAAEPAAAPERVAEMAIEAAKNGREARTYIDVTVSPDKSWSVFHTALEAGGDHGGVDKVWQALEAGSAAMVEYWAQEAGYSRAGYHGTKVAGRTSGRWVDGHDWTISAWRHHTSRLGQPQIHIHHAVLNRVQNPDGTYRAIDGAALVRVRAAAEAVFHRASEQALAESMGVRFVTRPDGVARSIAGVDPEVCELFSSRSRAIKSELAELVAIYTETYGRAPNAYQRSLMAQHATLKTRPRKLTHPPSRAEMLAEWEVQTTRELGKSMASVLASVDEDRRAHRDQVADTSYDPAEVIARAMAEVDRSKAVWTRYDLIGQLDRYLPEGVRGLGGSAAQTALNGLADRALASYDVVCVTAPELVEAPAALRRASDGHSIYEPPGAERYVTAALLDVEERLVLVARSTGGRRLDDVLVNRHLTQSSLSPGQANVARAVVTSDRRIQVLVGPAGTGKSRTMGEVAAMWEAQGGKVIGLTLAQNAAEVLAGEGVEHSANLAAFAAVQERIAAGRASRKDRQNFSLDSATLVILDEASMMSTRDLAAVVDQAHRAGAKVLVSGDDLQLGAVGAGGGMRLLITEAGSLNLDEVRRFEAPWEGPASLRLRSGDASVLDIYDRHGRLIEGNEEDVKAALTSAFVTSHLAGESSLVITSTNESASEMSSRIQRSLIDLGRVQPGQVPLRDDTTAGVGDLIEARANDATIVDLGGRRVTNRDTYVVTDVLNGGHLLVRRCRSDGSLAGEMHLPAAYVADKVELGYASTTHAVQGRTVRRCFTLVDENSTRAGVYVGMSRAQLENLAYVVVEAETDKLTEESPTNRFGVLADVLGRDDVEQSATEIAADERAGSQSLARLGPIWADCLGEDARLRYSEALHEVLTDDQRTALALDGESGPLWRLLRQAEQNGHDPVALLQASIEQRELGTADELGSVVYWRVQRRLEQLAADQSDLKNPEQPFGANRPSFTERTPAPETLSLVPEESYGVHARRLATVMDQRRMALGEQAAVEQPEWSAALGPVPAEDYDKAEWVERASLVAAYREQYSYEAPSDPIGPAPSLSANPERREAWEQAWVALGRPERHRDVAKLSDGQLANVVATYERQEAWAPPHVAPELRQAHLSARYWEQRATLDEERYPEAVATIGTRKLANDAGRRRAGYEEVNEAREAWYAHTAEDRARADLGRAELARRHPSKTVETEVVEESVTATPEQLQARRLVVDYTPEQPAQRPAEPMIKSVVDRSDETRRSRLGQALRRWRRGERRGDVAVGDEQAAERPVFEPTAAERASEAAEVAETPAKTPEVSTSPTEVAKVPARPTAASEAETDRALADALAKAYQARDRLAAAKARESREQSRRDAYQRQLQGPEPEELGLHLHR